MKASMKLGWLLIIFFTSINNIWAQNFSISNFEIEVDADNVLRYNATITTSDSASVYIVYSYTDNGEVHEQTSNVSAYDTNHQIPLIGFRANTGYSLQAFAFNNNAQVESLMEQILTAPLPFDIESNSGSVELNNIERQQFTIFHKLTSGINRHFKIIDSEGQIVWYDYYQVILQNCNGWRWTKNNTLIYGDCHVLHERDLFGNDLAIIPYANQNTNFHHDMMVLEDGNYATLYVQARELDLSGVGGTVDQRVAGDGYLIFNSDGIIIDEWNVFDHYFPENANQQGAYWNVVYGPNTIDWTHINAIDEDDDGNILLSVSHWDEIIKVNRQTDQVMWEFGEGAQIPTPTVFDYQHSITRTGNSRYMLFDNLGLNGRSRVLEFAINPVDFTATQIWSYVPDESIVAPVMGNSNRLENGNTFVNFGLAGTIHEVSETGDLLWDYRVGTSNYRAFKVPYLNKPHQQISVSLPDTLCLNDAPIEIGTNVTKPFLVGNGVDDGWFNPALAGAGEHTIAGFYGNTIDQETVVVLEAPAPTIVETNFELTIDDSYSDYQWFVNGNPISMTNSNTFIVENNGLYYATMLNEIGCLGYSDTINLIIAGEEAIAENLFEIKCIANQIQIINTTKTMVQFKLYDALGRLLQFENILPGFNTIEMDNIRFGMTIINIQNDAINYSKKIFIQ